MRHDSYRQTQDFPEDSAQAFKPAGPALPLSNPRLAESDEYLTNSHIFNEAADYALFTARLRGNLLFFNNQADTYLSLLTRLS
jgi:hypothetical protein